MSARSAILWARKRQAQQFTDRATVSRPVGEVTFDPNTGISAQDYSTRYTSIPCKVKTASLQGYDVQAAEAPVRLISREIEFPLEFSNAATSFALDDVVTLTDSEFNLSMIGEQYRVTDIDRRTWQVCHRVSVQEASVPEVWEGS